MSFYQNENFDNIHKNTHTRKADLLNLIHRKIFFFKWNKQHVYLYIYSRLNKSKNWWIASQCQQQVVCYKINFVIVFCFHCFAFWITHLVFVVKKKTTLTHGFNNLKCIYCVRMNWYVKKYSIKLNECVNSGETSSSSSTRTRHTLKWHEERIKIEYWCAQLYHWKINHRNLRFRC